MPPLHSLAIFRRRCRRLHAQPELYTSTSERFQPADASPVSIPQTLKMIANGWLVPSKGRFDSGLHPLNEASDFSQSQKAYKALQRQTRKFAGITKNCLFGIPDHAG